MGLTSTFKVSGLIKIDMSGWDYMVIQTNGLVSSVRVSNDGGAIEGSLEDSAITAPVSNFIITNQVLDLTTGTNAVFPVNGLLKIENIGRYVLIDQSFLSQELLIMLYKRG